MICTNSDTNLNFIDWKIKKLSSKITSNSPTNDIVLNIKNWKDLAKIIGYSPVNTGVSTIFSINSGYNLGVNLGKIIINHFL
jgi:hypothetical protein